MWLDANAVFTEPERPLEALVDTILVEAQISTRKDVCVIFSKDMYGPVNSGVFLICNTDRGRAFIKTPITVYPLSTTKISPERTVMASVANIKRSLARGEYKIKTQNNTFTVPRRHFNSFVADPFHPGPRLPEHAAWHKGDFVAHFPTIQGQRRSILMKRFMQNLDAAGSLYHGN